MKNCVIGLAVLCVLLSSSFSKDIFGQGLEKYEKQINEVAEYWKLILADQQKLDSIIKAVKDSSRLSADKETIISLLNSIYDNVRYKNEIMRHLTDIGQVRHRVAKQFKNEITQYRKYETAYRKEKKRIEKLPGCKPIYAEIDEEHKKFRKKVIEELKRQMWEGTKKDMDRKKNK